MTASMLWPLPHPAIAAAQAAAASMASGAATLLLDRNDLIAIPLINAVHALATSSCCDDGLRCAGMASNWQSWRKALIIDDETALAINLDRTSAAPHEAHTIRNAIDRAVRFALPARMIIAAARALVEEQNALAPWIESFDLFVDCSAFPSDDLHEADRMLAWTCQPERLQALVRAAVQPRFPNACEATSVRWIYHDIADAIVHAASRPDAPILSVTERLAREAPQYGVDSFTTTRATRLAARAIHCALHDALCEAFADDWLQPHTPQRADMLRSHARRRQDELAHASVRWSPLACVTLLHACPGDQDTMDRWRILVAEATDPPAMMPTSLYALYRVMRRSALNRANWREAASSATLTIIGCIERRMLQQRPSWRSDPTFARFVLMKQALMAAVRDPDAVRRVLWSNVESELRSDPLSVLHPARSWPPSPRLLAPIIDLARRHAANSDAPDDEAQLTLEACAWVEREQLSQSTSDA